MSNYFSHSLTNLLELFTSHSHKPSVLKGDINIDEMVEHVVDVVDPKIRAISRYKQKLTEPVSRTWDYLTNVANDIPAGVSLSRTAFSHDPRVRLVFDTQAVIQKLLDSVGPLIDAHDYKKRNTSSHVYMLLCMEKKEHNFLGTELEGDILKRDVMQTKVSFANRKFLSAGFTEDDAKLGFKKCAFEGLLHKAHGLIMESRKEQKQLIERKKQLHQKLHHIHDSKYKQHSSIFTRNDHLADAPPELQEIERRLTEIRINSDSPDAHLAQAFEVLSHPEKYLILQPQSLVLNNLGVKLAPGNSEGGINVVYAELEIEQSLKRITMIVNCVTDEVFSGSIVH